MNFTTKEMFSIFQLWTFHLYVAKLQHKYVPFVVSTSRTFPHSWLITGFVASMTRRMPVVGQELFTLPENLSWLLFFIVVRVAWALVFYLVLCRSLLVLFSFFFSTLCFLLFILIQTQKISKDNVNIITISFFFCINICFI